MDSSIAIIFGVVQGLTEFIPVSSSGHLLLLHRFLPPFSGVNELAFDAALHIGTLIALIVALWGDLKRMARALIARPSSMHDTDTRRLSWLILLGVIPAGVVGLLFDDFIEERLRSEYIVITMLIVVALLFFVVEWRRKGKPGHAIHALLWPQAVFIGVMQALALVPGTSRSGITIAAGMMMQLRREDAARFSFLLAIPITLAAALKKIVDLSMMEIGAHDVLLIVLGIVSAGIMGFMALRFLLAFVRTRTLIPFAIYRIGLAALALIIILSAST